MEESEVDATEVDEMAEPEPQRIGIRQWLAPAWFLLGVLVGVIGLTIYTAYIAKPAEDPTSMRTAAREGVLDAIATLNATQGQVPERNAPDPASISFNIRETNRLGNKNAKITIVEFSDFQ